MRTKKNNNSIRKSGYIDDSIYGDYLSDLELLTNQIVIEQENEIEKLSIVINNLIELKFNGNKKDAINYYKMMCDII